MKFYGDRGGAAFTCTPDILGPYNNELKTPPVLASKNKNGNFQGVTMLMHTNKYCVHSVGYMLLHLSSKCLEACDGSP